MEKSHRLVETRETIWMSANGQIRLEREQVTRARSKRQQAKGNWWVNRMAYFLTVKKGLGAGYQVNGKRGWTAKLGTHVKSYDRGGGMPSTRKLIQGRVTRNGNHSKPFFPGWF